MKAGVVERTRAAVCLMNAAYDLDNESHRRQRAFAFLSILHPELSLGKRLRMAAEIARGRKP